MIPSENINLRHREIPRFHATFKQNIHLTIRTSLRFRESEEDPYDTEETGTCPEESGFRTPAPA